MGLLHLYGTPIAHDLSHVTRQSPPISLVHLCPITACRWKRPDIKGKYFIKTLSLSYLLSSNLSLLSTAFYLAWRVLEALFIDRIIRLEILYGYFCCFLQTETVAVFLL